MVETQQRALGEEYWIVAEAFERNRGSGFYVISVILFGNNAIRNGAIKK